MRATNWEFTNRAMLFGLVIGLGFFAYTFDHESLVGTLADWLAPRLHAVPDAIARLILVLAAFVLSMAALIRTWASSYLRASVVYASDVKSDSLVADGPYRWVRNPLYFANVLMAASIGLMMSRTGFVIAIAAMILFCYRLILREENDLTAGQGFQYDAYRQAVPRLWPALTPRIAPAGRTADWAAGFRAESWYWGFALALFAFAITLKLWVFFAVMTASLVLFWVSSTLRARK